MRLLNGKFLILALSLFPVAGFSTPMDMKLVNRQFERFYGPLGGGKWVDINTYSGTPYNNDLPDTDKYQHEPKNPDDSVAVPEPTSMGLMALGLMGVVAARRKKKLS